MRVSLREVGPDEPLPRDDSAWDDWGDGPRVQPGGVERMIVVADGVDVGVVSWHPVAYGATLASRAYNIGIGLVAEHRGRGIGYRAQRLLAEHLFASTDIWRVEASTDVDNVAEQRSLEKAGFRREGVIRAAQVRRDGRHDLVGYAILRSDLERATTPGRAG